MSFESQLSDFTKKSLRHTNRVKKGAAIELFSRVILDTPVDEGRARGNWLTTIGGDPNYSVLRTGITGAANEVVTEVQRSKLEDTLVFTNNLPYIERLEDGHSKAQAPHGMVKKNIISMGHILKRKAAENGGL